MEETLGFEYASILVVQGRMLKLVSHQGYSKQLSLSLHLDGEEGVTVKAARTRKPVFVPDVKKEKTYVLGRSGMLSELAVPINFGNEVLGVLNVESERPAAFDNDDKKLLEILASHAAIAISNLRRRDQLSKLSNKMKHLMKNTTKTMHVENMNQRLKVIAKAIREFGWRRVVISLRDENLEGTDLVTTGLTEEEIERFSKEFPDILDAFSSLKEVETKNVEPSFHPIELKNVMREDAIEECLTQEEALSNAEQKEDKHFKGPRAV